jgi:hypothetical protein
MISVKGKGNEELMKQVSDLKGCLLQRDNEIAILVNMVKKGNALTYSLTYSLTHSLTHSLR